jgi:hypothetical protein
MTSWKMGTIFDKHSDSYAKYYSPIEHLAPVEVILLFSGRVTFKHYLLMKHKKFGIEIYKLSDSKGCTYNIIQYDCVFRHRREMCKSFHMATHATVAEPTAWLENVGHELYVGGLFLSPALFVSLTLI